MNKPHMLRFLCACFFMLLTTISCSNTDNENRSSSDIENDDLSSSTTESTVKDVDSASIVVNEVWVRDANEKGFEEQLLLEPKEVRLVPASGDNVELIVDLMLPAGEYDQVRLVLGSGTVTLSDNVYVADGHLFSTDLGNLKFPSGYQSGIKEMIEPPIEVVTSLSQELILTFELANSFVFNGPATHAPGVKSVLFKPVIHTVNNSTHGRITLRVTGSGGEKCVADHVAGAEVTAIDTSGVNENISTKTDQFGEAVIKLLPGIYDVLIEANGFEPITIQNNQVYIANVTELGDVDFGRSTVASLGFVQDRAILMAIMANYAYEDGKRGWLRGDFSNPEGKLPKLNYTSKYVNNDNFNLTTIDTDYTDCWERAGFLTAGDIDDSFLFDKGGDVFIANTVTEEKDGFVKTDKEDILVSFRGTDSTGNGDILTDAGIRKVSWTLRNCEGRLNGAATPPGCLGKEIGRAVSRGFRAAYDEVKLKLQEIINKTIFDKITDTSKSRVYFTGHSMGCAMAQLAALDLADYLVKVHGYERNNIIMYGIGCPRNITENLIERADDPDTPERERTYQMIVPNSFAINAKEDIVSHKPGRDADLDILFPAQYKHINKLIVLSTNIFDRSKHPQAERYAGFGKTRVERSNRAPFEGCRILRDLGLGLPNLSVPGTAYGKLGHDQLLYVKRLEDLVDTSLSPNGNSNGFPRINLGIVRDPTPNLPPFGNERIKLIWNASPEDSVMGPCDWVALYKGSSKPTDSSGYECKGFINRDGFEWVVKGEGYTSLGRSSHETCVNPTNNLGSRFWIGYIDGFNRIINTRGPYKNECSQFGGVLGNRCDKSRLVEQ